MLYLLRVSVESRSQRSRAVCNLGLVLRLYTRGYKRLYEMRDLTGTYYRTRQYLKFLNLKKKPFCENVEMRSKVSNNNKITFRKGTFGELCTCVDCTILPVSMNISLGIEVT